VLDTGDIEREDGDVALISSGDLGGICARISTTAAPGSG